ncbi:MAG: hypothetical protein QM734_10765 [Cyclobacteriaceae bacterium]
MKKILSLILMTGVTFAVSGQQQKGDIQAQAQFSYTSMTVSVSGSSQTVSIGQLYMNASKFITDNVELGVSPILSFVKYSGDSQTSLKFSAFANYSFLTDNAKLVPYAGGQLIVDTGAIDVDTGKQKTALGFGIKGGLRYFVTENINVDMGPSYSFYSNTNLLIFNIGLGYLFKK